MSHSSSQLPELQNLPNEILLHVLASIRDFSTLEAVKLAETRFLPLVNIQYGRLYARAFPARSTQMRNDPKFESDQQNWRNQYYQTIKEEIEYLNRYLVKNIRKFLKNPKEVNLKLEVLRKTIYALHTRNAQLDEIKMTDPLFPILLRIGARFQDQVIFDAIFQNVLRNQVAENATIAEKQKYQAQLLYYVIACNQNAATLSTVFDSAAQLICENPLGKQLSAIDLAINFNHHKAFELLFPKQTKYIQSDLKPDHNAPHKKTGVYDDNDTSVLLLATKQPEILAKILAKDFPYRFNVNARDADGFSALAGMFLSTRYKAIYDDEEIRAPIELESVKILIEHGAKRKFVDEHLIDLVNQILENDHRLVTPEDSEAILTLLFEGKEDKLINLQLEDKPVIYHAIDKSQIGLLRYLIKQGEGLGGKPTPNHEPHMQPSAIQYAIKRAYQRRFLVLDDKALEKIRHETTIIINEIINCIADPSQIRFEDIREILQAILNKKLNVSCLKTLRTRIDLNYFTLQPEPTKPAVSLLFHLAECMPLADFSKYLTYDIEVNIIHNGQTLLDVMLAKLNNITDPNLRLPHLDRIYLLIDRGAGLTTTQANIDNLWAGISSDTKEVMLNHLRPYPDVESTWQALYKFLDNEHAEINIKLTTHPTESLKKLLHLYEQLIAELTQIPLLQADMMQKRLKSIMSEIAIVAHHRQSTRKSSSLSGSLFANSPNRPAWNNWLKLNANLKGEYKKAHKTISEKYKNTVLNKPMSYSKYQKYKKSD